MQNKINREKLKELISSCNLREIFIDHLHWEEAQYTIPSISFKFAEKEYNFSVTTIAEKRGFVVCHARCENLPEKSVRQRLEAKLMRYHHEHLLILQSANDEQVWMLAVKPPDKSIRYVETIARHPDFVINNLLGIVFTIADEDGLDITDVVERVRGAFAQNTERVTRQFYDRFSQQLEKFTNFITGINELVDQKYYASLMLNRLMFIYFIQKKGYLDGDENYLKNRLKMVQEKQGKNQFHKFFYRNFLKELFHHGLGMPENERSAEVQILIGKVPYLNGGLFDEHQIEKEHDIDIEDKAFADIFAFFDQYQWLLDDRATAVGNEINPDVIGYIFEKYINERAQMGAYYTKEDITGYIARNTILPALLQKTKEQCKEAFDPQSGTIWKLLQDAPDNYIYESVRKGCNIPNTELPKNIQRGLDTTAENLLERRADWNKPADEKFALSGETWRETIARRTRYFALIEKIENGGVVDIADLTTHNLNIERLTESAIAHHEGTDFISALYFAIVGRKKMEGKNINERRCLSVLDPACGSGAFLFAALNVLQPLYRGCITRMRQFVREDDILRKTRHEEYRLILAEIEKHPNEKYWICRNIILHNLFGVDIMPDAAEVAKLRLFLKLAAESEVNNEKPNMGLEPLPDIDFNIRAGNSLVGFSHMAEFDEAVNKDLDLSSGLTKKIRDEAEKVGMTYKRFIDEQTINDIGSFSFKSVKNELRQMLEILNRKLNEYLALGYGINQGKDGKMPETQFAEWKKAHRPFHWAVEFYDIMKNGGFDVVIGNPPYVGYSPAFRIKEYTVMGYITDTARDLYAFVIEKSLLLLEKKGLFGMITPVSITTSNRCEGLRGLFEGREIWISSFADRPGTLFNGVDQVLTITIANSAINKSAHSAGFLHWYRTERENLFANLEYATSHFLGGVWGKIMNRIESQILDKIIQQKSTLENYFIPNGALVSVCGGTHTYYLRAFNAAQESREYKELYADKKNAASIAGIINSSVFYWFWRKFSNCRHLRQIDRNRFKVDLNEILIENLNAPACKAINALAQTKEFREGKLSYFQYRPARAKEAFDEIDKILAKHYGFTDEELDYIINYDYKYRMGGAVEDRQDL